MLQHQIFAAAGHPGKDRFFRDVNTIARIEHAQASGGGLDRQRMRELPLGKRQPCQRTPPAVRGRRTENAIRLVDRLGRTLGARRQGREIAAVTGWAQRLRLARQGGKRQPKHRGKQRNRGRPIGRLSQCVILPFDVMLRRVLRWEAWLGGAHGAAMPGRPPGENSSLNWIGTGSASMPARVRHTLAFGQELNHRTDTACTPLLNDQGAGWKTCPLVRNGQPGWPQPSGRIFWRFTLLLLRLPK